MQAPLARSAPRLLFVKRFEMSIVGAVAVASCCNLERDFAIDNQKVFQLRDGCSEEPATRKGVRKQAMKFSK